MRTLALVALFFATVWVLASVLALNAEEPLETIPRRELEGLPEIIALTVRGTGYQEDDTVLYNIQTEQLTPLVSSDGNDSHATWSPDGRQLALQTDRDGDWEIYTVEVETGRQTNITQNAASDMYPNWTPDGDVVHFSTRSGQAALWTTNPTSLDATGITDNDDCVPDYHPGWSPTNEYLAYRADCAGSGDIWRLDFDDNQRANLTAGSPATDRYPAVSPDGNMVLFVSDRDGNEEIYVMDADGTNVRNLTNNNARDKQASWSPFGQYIIFISNRTGNDALWIMEPNGSRPTLLLDSDTADFDWPWWQPPAPDAQEEDTMTTTTADADVEFVRAELRTDGTWRFSVTVAHPDTGWEDYADGWDVVLPDGTVLKPDPDSPFTRLLLHPHENEQPFTRSQSGIEIPDGVETVTVRAHDIVDGFGGQEVVVDLTQSSGENFEVVR
jgi:dipeptidyl aminopeptidase/acylaminoacyl peptidase